MSLEISVKKQWKGFSLDISMLHEGRCMGILGGSGCGKSMTLKCIAGIERPQEGRIVLGNRILFDSAKKINLKPQERKVGYLFQSYALFPNMRVKDNIGIGISLPKVEKKAVIREYMDRFQLDGLGERYPSELSGGQQQRVALARILASRPDMILLDEPFSALDSYLKASLQQELLELLKDYHGEVMIVSHNRDEIYQFCDKLTIMSQGKPLITGNTREVFQNPVKVDAARLTGCKNISPIKKISDYELVALDWNITLKTSKIIHDRIKYVGIRAHNLLPVEHEEGENTLSVKFISLIETQFEFEYLVKSSSFNAGETICWKMAKSAGSRGELSQEFPKFLTFPKEDLMLLE